MMVRKRRKDVGEKETGKIKDLNRTITLKLKFEFIV